MANTRYYTAEVCDPVTGETTTLTAHTEAELDRLVEEHLGIAFPEIA